MNNEYSYSRLSSFETCPYGWFLSYIMHSEGEGNVFADYGTMIHSIMERYTKGELPLWELCDTYDREFSELGEFPPNKFVDMRKSYHDGGMKYLSEFEGYDGYKILACERWFSICMGGFTYRGIIDLLLQDEYGNIILVDYKSKSGFSSKKERDKYLRQLYTYCVWVAKRYGRFPDILRLELIRGTPVDVVFDEKAYRSAIKWIYDTVKEIESAWVFEPKPNKWYCSELCDHRSSCEESGAYG